MTEYFNDCLVLVIKEYDLIDKLDTTVFIIYDKIKSEYIIRGKRSDESRKSESCTFSFKCEFAHELADFLTFIISVNHKWTYVLYNYDNLPSESDEITYDFLREFVSLDYELSGYEKTDFNEKFLLKNLRMLRNVFNYY